MKVAGSIQQVSPDLMMDPVGALDPAARVIPVGQALVAVGDAVGTTELAHRLAATIAMLWSDVAASDLFLPSGSSGELQGVRDPAAGRVLLHSVAVPHAAQAHADVRVIPVTPALAPGASREGSTMCAPVVASGGLARADRPERGEIEGFLIVQRRAGAPDFTARDVEALARLARGVGDLLPGVRARGGRSTAGWRARDLEEARDLQRQFLPRPAVANSAGARVLAEYIPAFDVGGDFYELVDLGGGRLLAAIGDVSGKGVSAALLMARVSAELHRLAASSAGPAEVLTRLNAGIARDRHGHPEDDRFVTVVCVLLDLPNRRWVVCNAGHVIPMLRRQSGAVTGFGYSSGPPVGMLEDPQYVDEELPIEPRDILVLATDGVFDNLSGERRPCSTMGQCKLTEMVEKAPHDLAEIQRRLVAAVRSAAAGRDDLALLGIELGA